MSVKLMPSLSNGNTNILAFELCGALYFSPNPMSPIYLVVVLIFGPYQPHSPWTTSVNTLATACESFFTTNNVLTLLHTYHISRRLDRWTYVGSQVVLAGSVAETKICTEKRTLQGGTSTTDSE